MEGNMFCYQCQEAAKGTGCVLRGVCGKKDTTARYMDLLLFVVRGVSVAADALRTKGHEVEAGTNEFVTDALFSTITNANFDDESILARVRKGTGTARLFEGTCRGMQVSSYRKQMTDTER